MGIDKSKSTKPCFLCLICLKCFPPCNVFSFILYTSVYKSLKSLIWTLWIKVRWMQVTAVDVKIIYTRSKRNHSARKIQCKSLISAFKSLYGSQFTLSTQLIKPSYFIVSQSVPICGSWNSFLHLVFLTILAGTTLEGVVFCGSNFD